MSLLIGKLQSPRDGTARAQFRSVVEGQSERECDFFVDLHDQHKSHPPHHPGEEGQPNMCHSHVATTNTITEGLCHKTCFEGCLTVNNFCESRGKRPGPTKVPKKILGRPIALHVHRDPKLVLCFVRCCLPPKV